MTKLILVTVGTSVIEKCYSNKENRTVEEIAQELEQEGESRNYYSELKSSILQNLPNNTDRCLKGKDKTYIKLSAEVASLLAMSRDESIGEITKEDKIILLHSDTVDGKLSAEVNAEVICKNLMKCSEFNYEEVEKDEYNKPITRIIKDLHSKEIMQIIRLVGLQPQNTHDFVEKGLTNLLQCIDELLQKHLPPQWDRFVNITGGYKGGIPIQTIQAEIKKVPIVYLFEYADLIKMKFTDDGIEIWIANMPASSSSVENYRRRVEGNLI